MSVFGDFLGGFGSWVAPVIGIIQDGLGGKTNNGNAQSDGTPSKGLMAPPSPMDSRRKSDIYDVQKFNPHMGYDKTSSNSANRGGGATNALPAIQSADPVSREVQFWTQVMAKSKAQAKIQ
jgi:hypothetical protein